MTKDIEELQEYRFRHLIIDRNFGLEKQHTITYNVIFFHIDGVLKVSWGKHKDVLINPGEIYFLPRGADISAQIISEKIEYIILRLVQDFENRPVFFELLKKERVNAGEYNQNNYPFPCIKMNEQMREYVNTVKRYSLDGIMNGQLYNIKLLELYIILHNYYSKEDCANLFYPILHYNLKFRGMILDNCKANITINELVNKSNMSRSTFDRNFKTAFGTTPLKWLEIQTRMLIMRKVAEPNISIKDIMYEVGILNPSQFTQLCKRLFGENPTQLLHHFGRQ